MKTFKKSLSILLAAIMLVSMFSICSFAANYVLVTPPTATLDAGQRLTLATRTLTGGEVIDSDTGEPATGAFKVVWTNPGPSTKIEVSQYCQVNISFEGVTLGTAYVFVRINGDENPQPPYPSNKKETEFAEVPTIVGTYAYDGVTTYGDIVLNGGIVVEKGTDTVVEGTMAITSPEPTNKLIAGERLLTVTFTPTDAEAYANCKTTLNIEVSKGNPAWIGETPVIEVPYGAQKSGKLVIDNKLLNAYDPTNPTVWEFPVYDLEQNFFGDKLFFEFGTHEYLVKPTTLLTTQATNWDKNTFLPVIVVVKPIEADIREVTYNTKTGVISGRICEPGSSYGSGKLNGTIDLTLGDEVISDIPVTSGRFSLDWRPEDITVDATVPVKAVYNGLEGEFAVVNEEFTGEIIFKADREIIIKSDKINIEIGNIMYTEDTYLTSGQEVEISAGVGDFAKWIITDTEGNPVELETTWNDTSSDWFKFIMPECDLVINAVFQYQLDEQAKIDNCECRCHSDNIFFKVYYDFLNAFYEILSIFGVEVPLCDCGYAHRTNTLTF